MTEELESSRPLRDGNLDFLVQLLLSSNKKEPSTTSTTTTIKSTTITSEEDKELDLFLESFVERIRGLTNKGWR